MRYYVAPVLWAVFILLLSSIPSDELPEFSFWRIFSFDKLVHVAMYGVLSFQVMKACIRQYANWWIRYNAARVSAVSGIIYGGLVELYQEYMLTDRYGDWMDMLANVIGTLIGIVIFKWIFFEYLR